jgi:hypothetical protein
VLAARCSRYLVTASRSALTLEKRAADERAQARLQISASSLGTLDE